MKKIILLNVLLAFSLLSTAQSKITGTVTDNNSEPIPGVNVLIKGTSTGTVTDVDGNFNVTVSPENILIFSFVGYVSEEITVGSQSVINVSMSEDIASLAEVIVIGYGTSTKRELTGATAQVDGESIEKMNMVRVDQALQGQMAGINISTESGAPGGRSNIRIRGYSTNGDNDPLILVDGIIYDSDGLNSLNPNDIESVNVLKDASAGIYGVRAANGVILITTKKGEFNAKTNFSFDAYYGIQETTKKLDLLNATEYAILKNEAFVAGGQAPPFSNVNLGEGTDWQNEVFEAAPIESYSLNVTGGGEKSSYSIGGSYLKQEGIVGGPKASFERIGGRLNFVTELAPKVKLTNVLLYTNELSSSIPQNGIGSVLYNATNAYPNEPVRTNNRFSYLELEADILNPLAQLENTHNETRVNKFVGKEEIDYQINDDFKLTARSGYSFALVDSKTFNPLTWYGPGKFANSAANEDLDPLVFDVGTVSFERGANVYEERNTFLDYSFEAFLNYGHTFGDVHAVKGTAGVSYIGNISEGLNGTGFNPINNSLDFADISASQSPAGVNFNGAGSFQSEQKLVSWFVRGEYSYNGRYLFSAVLRRDGSTNFGENNRFGYFPSASAAWLISDEDFLNNISFIDFAKIRVSYGVSGNDQINLFSYRGQLNGEGEYVFDDVIQTGAAIGQASNPDLQWETTKQFNVGLDLTVLNAIDVTANYFIKNTEDLLFQPDVSGLIGTYGAGGFPPVVNGGDVRNSGVELELVYNTTLNNGLGISVGYNAALLNNEVTATPSGVDFINGANFNVGGNPAVRFEKGFPIGYFVGLETNGVWQTQEEIAASTVSQPGAQPGDLKFVDQNGDGVISFGDNSDLTEVGSPIPDLTMGFNLRLDFKGIDLSANLYAALGQEVIRNYERQSPYTNLLSYAKNRWTGPGSTNEYPRLTTGATNNTIFSDFFVEDGSYLRMRNIQIGYTLPSSVTEKAKISSLRFYIGANNLFTLTKYRGFDPDVGSSFDEDNNRANVLSNGVDFGRYPQARVFMAGVNLKF